MGLVKNPAATSLKDFLQMKKKEILAESNLGKSVSEAGFWYLDRDGGPKDIVLDPLPAKLEWLAEKGKDVKKALKVITVINIKIINIILFMVFGVVQQVN